MVVFGSLVKLLRKRICQPHLDMTEVALRASLVAQRVKNLPAMQKTWVQSLGWEDPWRRERLPTLVFWPGEFHGLYSSWGHKESDMTEQPGYYSSLSSFDH